MSMPRRRDHLLSLSGPLPPSDIPFFCRFIGLAFEPTAIVC